MMNQRPSRSTLTDPHYPHTTLFRAHTGDRDDHAYQASISQRDACVVLDRFGLETVLADELRMKNLIELVRAGHRDRILVSQDYPLCLLGRGATLLPIIEPIWGITHIFEHILPRLAELGLADDDVEAILVQNPRALFMNAAAQLASGQ